VVDTGGVGVEDREVDALMSQQSLLALEEADCILFLVDARAGLVGLDQEIAIMLRKYNKPLYLIVNKVDGLDKEEALLDFQMLGFSHLFPISATHGRGMMALLDMLTALIPLKKEEAIEAKTGIAIAFVGRPNVGKSTLLNRILGEERVVVYDLPGTTRDSISVPFSREEEQYTFIDTAGIRRRARVDGKIEKFSIIKTLQAIKESHVSLLLVDAKEGVTEQDLHLLGLIIEAGKAIVIVVNKWDGLDEDHKNRVKATLQRRLAFASFAKVRFISALHGSGVGLLFQDIKEAYASATQRFSTPQITRLLEKIAQDHPPPLVKGRRIKLRYAHMGGHNPPIVVIHGNQVDKLPESYLRYMTNAFMKELHLQGTPLRIECKSHDNPFKEKKNVLTPRQIQKKKRLQKFVKRK
jgi:GTP-binding protein